MISEIHDPKEIKRRVRQLLPQTLAATLPTIEAWEQMPVSQWRFHVHLFGVTHGDWYVTAANRVGDGDYWCMVYVRGVGVDEWGPVLLSDLARMTFMGVAPMVERDARWGPTSLSSVCPKEDIPS